MSKQTIYTQLREGGMTQIGACAMLGNMQAESSITSTRVQRGYGMTDEWYTANVDSGKYAKFVNDGVGYGLCQWTFYQRKQNLMDFAKSNCVSIGNEIMQTAFCLMELKNRYTSVWKELSTGTDLYKATKKVCTDYEKPALNNIETRYTYAKSIFEQSKAWEKAVNDTPAKAEQPKETTAKGYDVNKVIQIALAEVGYIEKRNLSNLDDKTANGGSNNYTKYARDIDAIKGYFNGAKQGFAWCSTFISWCFIKAYGVDGARELLCLKENSSAAGCTYALRYFQNHGKFVKSPQKGDQVFFGTVNNSTHTGLVVDVKDGYVHTVEGNTSSAEYVVSNGGCVCQKKYPIGYSGICGYGRPNYAGSLVVNNSEIKTPSVTASGATSPTSVGGNTELYTFNIVLQQLAKGAKGKQVKAMQQLLVAGGYVKGTPDGEFGPNTESGVKAFQRANSLTVDGIAGEKTWNKLLK